MSGSEEHNNEDTVAHASHTSQTNEGMAPTHGQTGIVIDLTCDSD